jgi:MFS family permease
VPFLSGIFALASAFAPNMWVLSLFRFFMGLGIGAFGVAFNLFAEFLPSDKRGKALATFQGVWTVGIFFASALAWAVVPRLGWRWYLGLASTPFFVLMILLPLSSESPRFYLVHKKAAAAQNVLKRMSRVNKKALPAGLLVAIENLECGKILDLLRKPLRKLSLLIWTIFFSNNICYYGLVMFTPVYFASISRSSSSSSSSSGSLSSSAAEAALNDSTMDELTKLLIASAAEFPGVLISIFCIDK